MSGRNWIMCVPRPLACGVMSVTSVGAQCGCCWKGRMVGGRQHFGALKTDHLKININNNEVM